MKVYKMNDCDWVAAKSEEEAKVWYANECDFTQEEVNTDFEGEVSLEDTMFLLEEDVPEVEREKFSRDEVAGNVVYLVPFSWVIKHENITSECIIATTEC